jgi:amidase
LYGIPILLKDNIDTADMPTTAGSVALAGSIPPDDAFIVQKLRKAVRDHPRQGHADRIRELHRDWHADRLQLARRLWIQPVRPARGPSHHAPFNDGRPVLQTGGSSSGPGIGVNANLTAIAIGTETSGSILSPANANGIVGIKPTVGLVSRDGIIPITGGSGHGGPLTRTVQMPRILLGVIAGYDPIDPATAACLSPGIASATTPVSRRDGAERRTHCRVLSADSARANRQAIIDNAVQVLKAHGASVRTLAVSDIPRPARLVRSYPLPRFRRRPPSDARRSSCTGSSAI